MKYRTIALCGIAFALLAQQGYAQSTGARDEEIGRYTAATRGAQRLTYKLLDHCAQTTEQLREKAVEAREGWDQRNLPMVSVWRDVVRNWLRADGVADVDAEFARIEADSDKGLAALGEVQDSMVKTAIAAKPPSEQARSCGLLIGLIMGRGRDIQVTSPAVIKLHERYGTAPEPVGPAGAQAATDSQK